MPLPRSQSFLLYNHPNEIITLHVEDHSANSSGISSLVSRRELSNMVLHTNPNLDTVTLGIMRRSAKRLVIFSDYQYERGAENFQAQKGIFPTLFYKETIYGTVDFGGCEERKGDFRASYEDKSVTLFVHNHFHTVSVGSHALSNSYGSLASTK